ncbi:MAG: hypothetical protein LBG97_02860 [Coriobacteriales bacterium]|jgi:ATP-dependent DNA helicase DinG|nr:hypothetical protein [Coriobacteriales bacterium]
MNPDLKQLIIPGTPPDIVANYATLAKRAASAFLSTAEPEFVILDTETTGFNPEGESLIEVAAAIVCGPNILQRFSSFVNPGFPIPKLISELTNIYDSDVKDAPDALEAVTALGEFCGDRPVIAHNAPFDQSFILANAPANSLSPLGNAQPVFAREPWIDTVALARIALPRLRAHNMELLSAAFSPHKKSTHRAIDDVEALCAIWRVLLVALCDLPAGMPMFLSQIASSNDWSLRSVLAMAANATNSPESFSLNKARHQRKSQLVKQRKIDAAELDAHEFYKLSEPEIMLAYSKDGMLASMYEGFEPRQEQAQMAVAVANAFNDETNLAIEAGTGVGKSMAYLLPQALFARRNNICCGVATKTNALLDQLVYSELPRLQKTLSEHNGQIRYGNTGGLNELSGYDAPASFNELPLQYVALKGYSHYPCLRKLMKLARQDRKYKNSEPLLLIAQLLTFAVQSTNSDIDSAVVRFGELARFEVCSNALDCLKRKCSYYHSCMLHGVRREAQSADIVVTNHALLFCDIMTEGALLPPICHWVVDEAHSAASEARRQTAVNLDARSLRSTLESILHQGGILFALKNLAARSSGGDDAIALIDSVISSANNILAISDSFFSYLKDLTSLAESSSYDRVDLWINNYVRDSQEWGFLHSAGKALAQRLDALQNDCRGIITAFNKLEEADDFSFAEPIGDLVGLVSNIASTNNALETILGGGDPAFVYYASLNRREDSLQDSLIAEYVNVGEVLSQTFYPLQRSVVFSSATIATGNEDESIYDGNAATNISAGTGVVAGSATGTGVVAGSATGTGVVAGSATGGGTTKSAVATRGATVSRACEGIGSSFNYFARGVGLDLLPLKQTKTLRLKSCYDFDKQMTVLLPTNMPEPNEPTFRSSLQNFLLSLHLAMGGSVLTLFTNRREMETIFTNLKDELNAHGLTLRCQFSGTSNKRLRDEFVANESLSLFALRSFWEGFDAPGDTLRCVVIPRLPFGRPNDPLQKQREQNEGNSWKNYSLPEAIIDLKQAAGRLIRTSTDTGYLVLADSRLTHKSYGAEFLRALPSQNIQRLKCEELLEFIRQRKR